uniref:Bradykinin-potentiating peptide 2 n=1 Tax=Bothrops neuwiedi TaxID=95648 RepID=BPP2_BOTNU|nr:RecName: Full=Bradykinin-potentiating peptide 2; Short=BPP-2; AltName: Full=BPP-II [Bothrops neuwiedi]
EEGGRPPPPI